MKLSIVIPHVGEPDELQATVNSIRNTAGDVVEIVVVDDCSTPTPTVHGADKFIVNTQRCGTGPSRHIGAEHAKGTHILITDCHMRFPDGWYDEFLSNVFFQDSRGIRHDPYAIYCGTCLALDDNNMDVNHPRDEYHGATFNFFGPDKFRPGLTQIFEGVWGPKKTDDLYETPCCMGACYIVPRSFYLKLSPHRYLRRWGVEEQALSLKAWLSGGRVIQANKIRIGHKFRINPKRLPFNLKIADIIYNKLFVMYTCLPEEYARGMMKKFPRDADFNLAYQRLNENWPLVAVERAYNQNIFNTSFDSLLSRWGLQCPK